MNKIIDTIAFLFIIILLISIISYAVYDTTMNIKINNRAEAACYPYKLIQRYTETENYWSYNGKLYVICSNNVGVQFKEVSK